jgi:hypothetical protein
MVNLPKGIIHKRDYISCGKTFKTSYQSINELIESSTGVIQFQKIRDAFPGVQDYVFFSCLSKRNDIIWLLGKETLILGKNITLSTELIDAISFEIETLFSILNTKSNKLLKALCQNDYYASQFNANDSNDRFKVCFLFPYLLSI